MSEWNVRPGELVDPAKTREIAKQIWKGLVYFAILKTHDPKKQAALDRLTELRLQVQEQLDVLAPGYLE